MASSTQKLLNTLRWLPDSMLRRALARRPEAPFHVLIALADHFEPSIVPGRGGEFASLAVQVERMKKWCTRYPEAVDDLRDADGHAFKHTYFYPAEQHHDDVVGLLAEHCRSGWGEAEIHLHHGVQQPDSASHTREQLECFRDTLAGYGCLSRMDGVGPARYAFVHGNWTLANSGLGCCGVDDELQVLADTGCYGDFTLPSAPDLAQTALTNSIYECARPLKERAAHRSGKRLRVGTRPAIFPLIFQGPLMMAMERVNGGLRPKIENAELSGKRPPTMQRLERWISCGISVVGRPDWIFVKLHCHGMDPRDEPSMLGEGLRKFLRELTARSSDGSEEFVPHYVTAREMTNIALAACDGKSGNPGAFRDYRLKLRLSS